MAGEEEGKTPAVPDWPMSLAALAPSTLYLTLTGVFIISFWALVFPSSFHNSF